MATIRRTSNGNPTKEYGIYKAMKSRCYSPSNSNSEYQLKGIKVCDRWLESFENFLQDMGKCPENHSLDRYPDNDGDYSPDNCRWATNQQQSSNRGSFNKLFTHNGVTKTLKDWSKYFNIKYLTLYSRIYRTGLTFEDAIKPDPFKRLFEHNGKKLTLKEWSVETGIPYSRLAERHSRKWSVKKMLEQPVRKRSTKKQVNN